MLHFLHINLKISFVSIFAMLNVFVPHPTWHDECRSEQLLLDLKSRSLNVDIRPSMSVPPYDLSTPLKQWRYLGEKNGYADYFELDDVLVFPDTGSNDAFDISNYDLPSFTELLKYYLAYQNELEAAYTLPMDNAAMEGLVELKLHDPAEPTIEAIAEILWNQLNEDKQSNTTGGNSLISNDAFLFGNGPFVQLNDSISTLWKSVLKYPLDSENNDKWMNSIFIEHPADDIPVFFQDSINCKQLFKNALDYTKAVSLRAAGSKVLTHHNYYHGYGLHKSKGFKTFKEGYKQLIIKLKEDFKNCAYKPGDKIEAPFLDEPYDLCVLGFGYYHIRIASNENPEDAVLQAYNEVLFAKALLPGGMASKILDFTKNNCIDSAKTNQEIEIYDITIFKSSLDNFKYFHVEKDKDLGKNLKARIAPQFETMKTTCDKALNIIDEQSRHWHTIVNAIEATYLYLDPKKHKDNFSYVKDHRIKEIHAFAPMIKMASLILSSNGYLKRNIDTYDSECISTYKDASGVYEIRSKKLFNYVTDLNTTIYHNLTPAHDRIVAKDFRNFSAPKLESKSKE